MFNPGQPRDEDGKWISGGGYVGRRRAASQVDRAKRTFAPRQVQARTAAARTATGGTIRVASSRVTPLGTAKADATIGAAKRYRARIASGELKIKPASPSNKRKYGAEFPAEVAVREYGDKEVAKARYLLGHDRDVRQRRSSNPAVARKQKVNRAGLLEAGNRTGGERPALRGGAKFPRLSAAKIRALRASAK